MRSKQIEAWLDREGVAWGYVQSIALTEFDEESSLANQARIGVTLIPELVEAYTIAMLNGDEFPAVVCYKGPRGLIIIDGNHTRAASREVGKVAIDAYVVANGTTPLQIRTLTRVANTLNGERPKREHTILQAVEHVLETGATARETAALFGVSNEALNVAIRDRRTRDRLIRAGMNVSAVPARKLERLGSLQSTPVLMKAADLVATCKLTDNEIAALRQKLLERPTEAAQLRYIEERRNDPMMRARAKKGVASPTYRAASRLLGMVRGARGYIDRDRVVLTNQLAGTSMAQEMAGMLREVLAFVEGLDEKPAA